MTGRRELIRRLVLRSIADDYESLELIGGLVSRLSPEQAVTVARTEIAEALEDLVSQGFAQAYVLSHRQHQPARPVPYYPGSSEDLWFYVTRKGLDTLEASDEK